eukprot:CAMPEP_0197239050 /NCGR_PEP_ID=MMETSP1429-20130617/5554_1 /TAXON_ID=49237 /ORGANISM="Chaetoceros  sp., Strain UNC1202" /LENGTH=71 /DNA_ID=CAMNT_0042698365 /DNA_START=255 /DNA_END=470 /DNA_ORIENTATION=+
MVFGLHFDLANETEFKACTSCPTMEEEDEQSIMTTVAGKCGVGLKREILCNVERIVHILNTSSVDEVRPSD